MLLKSTKQEKTTEIDHDNTVKRKNEKKNI